MNPGLTAAKWLARQAWTFVLVVSILAVGGLVYDRFRTDSADAHRLQTLSSARDALARFADDASGDAEKRLEDLADASEDRLREQLAAVDSEIRRLQEIQDASTVDIVLRIVTSDGIAYAKDSIRLELLGIERDFLDKLLASTSALRGKAAAEQELLARRARNLQIYAAIKTNEARQAHLRADSPFPPCLWPWSDECRELERLEDEHRRLAREYGRAIALYEEQRRWVERVQVPPRPRTPDVRSKTAEEFLERIGTEIERRRKSMESSWLQNFLRYGAGKVPTALWILAGVVFVPPLTRLLLYYGVAPVVGRLRPICIIPNENAPEISDPPRSAVSLSLQVGPEEELLVRPGNLQSSSLLARKDTQWLLNYRFFLASLASGMYGLTRIRAEGDEATRVVLSAKGDGLSELGLVELPPGASVIIRPRALAAVVKPRQSPVRISRHWRLGSLHAWLTLQLRYLAVHGPCRLVLKGARGVRAEAPVPGQPRMIDQAATLGFSANLLYQTTRCETFNAYFFGHERLFNDLFGGGPGRFFYEEMPSGAASRSSIVRTLEGLRDAALKVVGI
jgi:uncharacterized protein (AIM24 family)